MYLKLMVLGSNIKFKTCTKPITSVTFLSFCSVDASAEDDSLGRFVNDEQKNPSCELKTVVYEGKPHLCLFALKKISPGEEITFNYGNRFYPWRSEVRLFIFPLVLS